MNNLKSIWKAPVGVEILAWHKEGKNFHQVKLKEDGSFGMRWATDYRQHPNCYSGWLPMPTLDGQAELDERGQEQHVYILGLELQSLREKVEGIKKALYSELVDACHAANSEIEDELAHAMHDKLQEQCDLFLSLIDEIIKEGE